MFLLRKRSPINRLHGKRNRCSHIEKVLSLTRRQVWRSSRIAHYRDSVVGTKFDLQVDKYSL